MLSLGSTVRTLGAVTRPGPGLLGCLLTTVLKVQASSPPLGLPMGTQVAARSQALWGHPSGYTEHSLLTPRAYHFS